MWLTRKAAPILAGMFGPKLLLTPLLALLLACDTADLPAPPDDAGVPLVDGSVPLPERGTTLHVRVVDAQTGLPIPAKVFFIKDGVPLTLASTADPPFCTGTGSSMTELGTGGALATYNGVLVWRGDANIPIGTPWTNPKNRCGEAQTRQIPFGDYTLRFSRGVEYDLAEAKLTLGPDQGVVDLLVPLARVVDTSGYLSSDMHIHSALTADGQGSNDSGMSAINRVKTELAAGIEVLISSDHDAITDYNVPLKMLWPDPANPPPGVAIVGDEATAGFGAHFNVMPVTGFTGPLVVSGLAPKELFDTLHGWGTTAPLIQLNHARLGFAAYFDAAVCGPWRDHTTLPPCHLGFDTMEVLSGWLSCDTKIRAALDDWYTMARFGLVKTGVGASDSHFDVGINAGFPRTYVRVANDSMAGYDEGEFIEALRHRAAIATTGPFVSMTADGVSREGDTLTVQGGTVRVAIRVSSPSWIKSSTLKLLVDGAVVKTWPVDLAATQGVFAVEESLAIAKDAFINAEVWGNEPIPDWITGNYISTYKYPETGTFACPNDSAMPGMIPFGVTNFILADADGDGVWRAVSQPAAAHNPPDRFIAAPEGECGPGETSGQRLIKPDEAVAAKRFK